jgi:hypothetical protein
MWRGVLWGDGGFFWFRFDRSLRLLSLSSFVVCRRQKL